MYTCACVCMYVTTFCFAKWTKQTCSPKKGIVWVGRQAKLTPSGHSEPNKMTNYIRPVRKTDTTRWLKFGGLKQIILLQQWSRWAVCVQLTWVNVPVMAQGIYRKPVPCSIFVQVHGTFCWAMYLHKACMVNISVWLILVKFQIVQVLYDQVMETSSWYELVTISGTPPFF